MKNDMNVDNLQKAADKIENSYQEAVSKLQKEGQEVLVLMRGLIKKKEEQKIKNLRKKLLVNN